MNYKIITNEKALKEFIEWLPELKFDEKYYLCLFARNKYCKELVHIKTDKAQLKRFISDKERLFNKISQLEIPLGCYKQKHLEVPQQALALYIIPNPRNMMRATVNTMVKLAQSIRDQNVAMNPHQEALSEIQKAKSRTVFVDFDLDYENKISGTGDILKEYVYTLVGKTAKIEILESRGGFHILINPSTVEEIFKKSWYKELSKHPNVDQVGDLMIPVPGCFQGGFTPKFI